MVERKGKIRVAVMMGGFSSERGVSLSTGKRILESLDRDKYEPIGVDAAMLPGSARQCLEGASEEVGAIAAAGSALAASTRLVSVQEIASNGSLRPDVVFIALHGKYGEDGTIQGMLDLLGIPYTGSGVLASALAMDKSMCKKVLAADGIPVPPSVDFACDTRGLPRNPPVSPLSKGGPQSVSPLTKGGLRGVEAVARAVAKIGYPVIVKPSRQGSSIGLTKVNAPEELNTAIKEAAGYDGLIIVEKYLEGTELTVGVLGNDELIALPVIEIAPRSGMYDYKSKYDPGATEEIVPARISDADTARAQELGLAAHRSLGCRGASRTDIIMTADGMYVLEVNTIPGMTPTSLLPTAAAAAGIPFGGLLDMLIEFALEEGSER